MEGTSPYSGTGVIGWQWLSPLSIEEIGFPYDHVAHIVLQVPRVLHPFSPEYTHSLTHSPTNSYPPSPPPLTLPSSFFVLLLRPPFLARLLKRCIFTPYSPSPTTTTPSLTIIRCCHSISVPLHLSPIRGSRITLPFVSASLCHPPLPSSLTTLLPSLSSLATKLVHLGNDLKLVLIPKHTNTHTRSLP